MARTQAQLLHVVAIPYPAQGHINPLLQLCEQLVPRGFTFTFINTHHIHQRLQQSGLLLHPVHDAPDAAHHFHMEALLHRHDNLQAASVKLQKEENSSLCNYAQAHHRQDIVDANDVVSCQADSHISLHDTFNGNGGGGDVQAQEVYHYRGCSSIRMVFVAGGCPPEKLARVSTAHEAFRAAQEMCEPVEHMLSHITEEKAIDFILSDVVLGWSSGTARKFDVPCVSFWPASAASLCAFIYFADLSTQGKTSIPIAEMEAGEPFLIPGLPPAHISDVPKIWDADGQLYEELLGHFKALHHASLVLLNTVEALEGQALQALSNHFPVLGVGPLVPSHYLFHSSVDGEPLAPLSRPSLYREDSRCLAWLDTQAASSVLFISFGSISLRSHEQHEELAKGIEASGCPFLWVCKPDISNNPDNRYEHTFPTHKNGLPRGLIVSWAPQLQVLSHPSIGGFITHCGWNSIMESVSMGVPMLCWADTTERMSNQRFVVEFWKCGIYMIPDMRRAKQNIDEAVLIGRDEVEKSIRFLMLEEGGVSIRLHSAKLRDVAIKAYLDSHSRLNKFTETVEQGCLYTYGYCR